MEGMTSPMVTYDLADRQNDGFGFGGGSGLWLFAILALMWGGNGFGFGGRQANVATQDDLNFSRLEAQVRANADLTERKVDGIANGLSSLGYEMAQQFGRTNTQMATGFCQVDKEIMESRYLNEKAIADSNASLTAQITAISQKMDQNKIESLQAQINQLQMQQALCGVVRYPTSTTYCSGANPFSCGCGCYNNNI